MKLAEALQERADLNRRIQQLRARLLDNALVQEGEQPAEDPAVLMSEYDAAAAALEEITAKINLANCKTTVDGKSLTELIAKRDTLTQRLKTYRDLAQAASRPYQRAARSEIKILSAVDVKDLQKRADRVAKELRLLDNTIQQTNWTVDL